MGHADINTTMDIYAEVTEAKKRESMENLSKNLKVFQERVQKEDSRICNKKAILQQICNEFGFDSAYRYRIVHGQKSKKKASLSDNAKQCMKRETHSGRVATIIE